MKTSMLQGKVVRYFPTKRLDLFNLTYDTIHPHSLLLFIINNLALVNEDPKIIDSSDQDDYDHIFNKINVEEFEEVDISCSQKDKQK